MSCVLKGGRKANEASITRGAAAEHRMECKPLLAVLLGDPSSGGGVHDVVRGEIDEGNVLQPLLVLDVLGHERRCDDIAVELQHLCLRGRKVSLDLVRRDLCRVFFRQLAVCRWFVLDQHG